MINNYEEQIIHDILYLARGKGFITEIEVFNYARPMILGYSHLKIDNDIGLASYLLNGKTNLLQSYNIFDSIKRLVALEKLRVESCGNNCNYIFIAMQTAKKYCLYHDLVKNYLSNKSSLENRYYKKLDNMYGIYDGEIKERCCGMTASIEVSLLLNIKNLFDND